MHLNYYSSNFFLLLFLFFITQVNAQVTIGAKEAPSEGALLDLKEWTETKGEANSTKGMMLPRVNLDLVPSLKPLVNISNNDPESSNYAGMLLFNTNRHFKLEGDDTGIYLWDSESWNALVEKQESSVVKSFIDHEGNKYRYRKFGTAGEWMIENLRTRTYAPNLNEAIQPSLTAEHKKYGYPNYEKEYVDDDSYFKYYPIVGLVYKSSAALNYNGSLSDAITSAGGDLTIFEGVQGICPEGWYIPTIDDWNELIAEVELNRTEYATAPDLSSASNASLLKSNSIGFAGQDPTTPNLLGYSNPLSKGGFSWIVSGIVTEKTGKNGLVGVMSYMQSSSLGMHLRDPGVLSPAVGTQNSIVDEYILENHYYAPVRCKKKETP